MSTRNTDSVQHFSDFEVKMILEGMIERCETILHDAVRRNKQVTTELEWIMSHSEDTNSFIHTCYAIDRDPNTERNRLLGIYKEALRRNGQGGIN